MLRSSPTLSIGAGAASPPHLFSDVTQILPATTIMLGELSCVA
jgi:hypothetical protein